MPAEAESPKSQQGIFWIFLLFLMVAAGGAAYLYYQSDWRVPAEMKKLQNPLASNTQAVGAGMMIYMEHCQACHGENGDGKGPKAEKLSIRPADFTDAAAMSRVSDGELYWKITHGRRPMPSFKDKLMDEERWQVVAYIRTFTQKHSATGTARP